MTNPAQGVGEPPLLQGVLTGKAIANRKQLQTRLTGYLELPAVIAALGEKVAALRNADDIFAPVAPLEPPACDALCALLWSSRRTVALLHSRSSPAGPEGLGRTSLLLHALGVEIVPRSAPTDPDRIPGAEPPTLQRVRDSEFRLVTCDWAYLSAPEGRLLVTPSLAEPLLALWDVARCAFRSTDRSYVKGKRLSPLGREILDAQVQRLPAHEILALYRRDAGRVAVDRAVILEVAEGVTVVARQDPPPARALPLLGAALESVLHLATSFWDRSPERHRELVRAVTASLHQIPEIVRIVIPAGPGSTGPQHLAAVRGLLQGALSP